MENAVPVGSAHLWTHISAASREEKPYLCLCGGGPGIGDYLEEWKS